MIQLQKTLILSLACQILLDFSGTCFSPYVPPIRGYFSFFIDSTSFLFGFPKLRLTPSWPPFRTMGFSISQRHFGVAKNDPPGPHIYPKISSISSHDYPIHIPWHIPLHSPIHISLIWSSIKHHLPSWTIIDHRYSILSILGKPQASMETNCVTRISWETPMSCVEPEDLYSLCVNDKEVQRRTAAGSTWGGSIVMGRPPIAGWFLLGTIPSRKF